MAIYPGGLTVAVSIGWTNRGYLPGWTSSGNPGELTVAICQGIISLAIFNNSGYLFRGD